MVFPKAAATPNHMPRTFSRRPVVRGRFEWAIGVVVNGSCQEKE
jgi:hypothetical protein